MRKGECDISPGVASPREIELVTVIELPVLHSRKPHLSGHYVEISVRLKPDATARRRRPAKAGHDRGSPAKAGHYR